MTIQFAKTREMYNDGTIEKSGKSELKKEFLKHFQDKTDEHFAQIMNLGKKNQRLPTPMEEDWLNKYVAMYHARYKAHRMGAEAAKQKPQLSLPIS